MRDDDAEKGWLRLSDDLLEGRQRFEYGQGPAFCRAVARYRDWLEGEARKIVGEDKERARCAVQWALARLWEWDVRRFGPADDGYLRRALMTALRMAATGGPSRRPQHASLSRLRIHQKKSERYFASVRGMELE